MTISTPMRIFLWVIVSLWLGGGVLSFFLLDRYTGMLLMFSFLMVFGLVGLVAALLWVLERILAFLHLKFKVQDVDLGKLVLSSKTETVSPVAPSQGTLDALPVGKTDVPATGVKSLRSRIWAFLSEPPAKGQMSNRRALIVIAIFLGVVISPFGYIWYSVGTTKFLTFMKYLLAIGIPILLLSLFETGRNILKGLFMFLQLLIVFFEIIGGVSSKGSSDSGGGFGGGGASGKW